MTPSESFPGLHAWLDTPLGRYVMAWEAARFDGLVADIFGYNAVQLGVPESDFLRANRMPFRFRAGAGDVLERPVHLKEALWRVETLQEKVERLDDSLSI